MLLLLAIHSKEEMQTRSSVVSASSCWWCISWPNYPSSLCGNGELFVVWVCEGGRAFKQSEWGMDLWDCHISSSWRGLAVETLVVCILLSFEAVIAILQWRWDWDWLIPLCAYPPSLPCPVFLLACVYFFPKWSFSSEEFCEEPLLVKEELRNNLSAAKCLLIVAGDGQGFTC